ncbi:hypothetical protein [Fictibacillus barbaricus]|uniref:Uncharacterized membrane protein YjjP (DUF1212 family) n=1 Tax=Fictibacillus barbaricus TaxID=182136 RepID=A0ABU1U1G0_9BACL|nr:hypothetical protein [Fictibacillus barbaricus]MDR7073297.1 uncharacterized membrane protein YjjP (DUF1212 family) [Fictibacillus barbaricus]
MEETQIPKRSERIKNRKKSGPPMILIGWGLMWLLLYTVPEEWKSIWLSIVIVVISLLVSFLIDKANINSKIKWIVSLSIYIVGIIIYVLQH